jgi:acetyltransferase-like isoleucine patch superfamily enzyme
MGGGVAIKDPSTLFVGYGTIFDTVNPQGIIIDESVVITTGVTILSHYLDTSKPGLEFKLGTVHIHKNVFIGANATICNSVEIGEGAVIGAGAVVTKDVPAGEIWAGNPARFIKSRMPGD